MKKIMKRVGALLAVVFATVLIISIISVNVRYHKYFDITELGMDEQYTTEWGSVSIDKARILSQEELIKEYPDTKKYIYDTEEDKAYVIVYATFDVSDADKYDSEWFKMWTIEADKVWSNGKDMMINSCLNENNKITENGIYEMYCVFGFIPRNILLNEYDEAYNLKYRVMINHNPIIFYKLDITEEKYH